MKKERKKKHKSRKKKGNIISNIILVIAAVVFVFSFFMLVDSLVPYFKGGQEYDDVRKQAIKKETVKDGEEEIFTVDFDLLKEQNADTIAWIRFDEPAVISYPVVKSKDNNEYLTTTFTANYNKLGTIFMDMNCSSDFTDRNTIIYGHNMQVGGEMFSQLNAYAEESFCRQHPYFYIYTPDDKVLTYQIFMAGIVKDTAVNYTYKFGSDDEFLSYLDSCRASSNYTVEAGLDAGAKIVTLSTCTNVRDDERFIIQGVLIKDEVNK
ncbi:MAG: class B sortase [Schaedlerella sp.]|nr:class B sortase [Schaedlerella sp.]